MAPCEVRARIDGKAEAPPLVLLHSLGAGIAMWDPQVAGLGDRLRLVRYDARGHGGSPVPDGPYSLADLGGDLIALLDRLGLERASLCGVSLGGATALWAAINAPARVERLVVCFSAARFGPAEDWLARAALVRAEGAGAVAEAVVGRWLTAPTLSSRPQLAARMREMIAATPAEGYAGCCEALAATDLRGRAGRDRRPDPGDLRQRGPRDAARARPRGRRRHPRRRVRRAAGGGSSRKLRASSRGQPPDPPPPP